MEQLAAEFAEFHSRIFFSGSYYKRYECAVVIESDEITFWYSQEAYQNHRVRVRTSVTIAEISYRDIERIELFLAGRIRNSRFIASEYDGHKGSISATVSGFWISRNNIL